MAPQPSSTEPGLTVGTANVNGIRAATGKGFVDWLAASGADVVCLQEVRALPEELPGPLLSAGWKITLATAAARGRNGVAVLTRTRLRELRDKAAAEDREVLVCGDWNLAHAELDVRYWRVNRRNSGFLAHEREWASELLDSYVDVLRVLHPGVEGPYSWWTYRGQAFDKDVGWRIDFQLATPGLAARAEAAWVDHPASRSARWPGHAPVTVRYASAPGELV